MRQSAVGWSCDFQGVPLEQMHITLVLTRARRLCFHSSELDNYRSLGWSCGHSCELSHRPCRGNKGNAAEEYTVVGGVSRVLGWQMAFLIDFLVLSQFFITTSPSPCRRCAAQDLSFGLLPAESSSLLLLLLRERRGEREGALVYSQAWGLIYERKSSSVQFLTANADNGGGWMKQFVTSSLH